VSGPGLRKPVERHAIYGTEPNAHSGSVVLVRLAVVVMAVHLQHDHFSCSHIATAMHEGSRKIAHALAAASGYRVVYRVVL
jgi:hypothetical protein